MSRSLTESRRSCTATRASHGRPPTLVRARDIDQRPRAGCAARGAPVSAAARPHSSLPYRHTPILSVPAAAAVAPAGREKTRLTAASGDRVTGAAASAHIGAPFAPRADPSFLADRAAVYDEVIAEQRARIARKPRQPIRITLPDGKEIEGTSWETTPLAIAEGISKGLAAAVIVARVAHTTRVGLEAADGGGIVNTGPEEEVAEASLSGGAAAPAAAAQAELWDLTRPLEGDCRLELLKFDDKDGKMVFWHSSAHVLGECLECGYSAQLCIGPPTEDGFYYDAYLGGRCAASSRTGSDLRLRLLELMHVPPLASPPQLAPRERFRGHPRPRRGRVQVQTDV